MRFQFQKQYLNNHKLLMQEWDYNKNEQLGLDPGGLSCGSQKKAWWICPKGHKYEAVIRSRAIRGDGCPYCSGHRAISGVNDFATLYPKIAAEWDYKKNGELGITPDTVSYASQKKVGWICPKGHKYETTINKRTLRGNGCPICSGHKTVPGINDFATLYPEIAKEWHPTRNGDLKANEVSQKNGRKVWWQCKYGHEWQATVKDRVIDNTGCPTCAALLQTSFPEQAIYYYVKKIYPDAVNRYTDVFDNSMELDIYIPSIRLGIEYDGAHWHRTQKEHDREIQKYEICKSHNITLHRVKEKIVEWNDVADGIYFINNRRDKKELTQVIQAIINSIDPEVNIWTRKNPFKIMSDTIVDLERDANEIRSYLIPIPYSISDLRPDLVEDWDYEKNGTLRPEMFGIHSNEIVWWKCHVCGHSWKTMINHRGGKRSSGCPECSKMKRGKSFTRSKVRERGSLAEVNPELAKEWHPTKNGDLRPEDITEGRFKPVWWLCPKCGYEWQASPNNRKKGVGCPCCSGRVPMSGVNDLATVVPELLKEWDYEKNKVGPENFLPKSGKIVWWKCQTCGHEWKTVISNRSNGHGCPKCRKRKK